MTPTSNALDVRASFPFLERKVNGKSLVYFDNAATTQKPKAVLQAIQNVYEGGISNVHRAVNFLADEVTQRFEGSRRIAARLLGAHSREIVFVANSTQGLNLVCGSLAAHRPGLRVITTTLEHHSNLLPWMRNGAVDYVPWTAEDGIDTARLRELLSATGVERPALVTLQCVSNFLGTVQPVSEVIALCREFDVPVLLDASQSIAHEAVDVEELGCDFLVFSGHKVYGPGGTGVLFMRSEWAERLQPAWVGGSMVKEVHRDRYVLNDMPHRFEAGTPNIEGAIGLAAALQFVMDTGYEAIAEHEARLLEYARERMRRIPNVTLHGRQSGRRGAPIVPFSIQGLSAGDAVKVLAARANVIVRSGFHCAQPAHEELGLGPTIRASFAMYNTTAEIDTLAEVLETFARFVH